MKGEGNVGGFVEFEDAGGWQHTLHGSRVWLTQHGGKWYAIINDGSEVGSTHPITPAVYADLRARLLGEEPQDPRYDALAAICRGLGFTSSVEVDYNHAPPRIGILLCDHADAQDRRLLAEVLATFVERHGCPAVTVSVEEAKP